MAFRVILLSGPVAAGKSTLAATLIERYGIRLLKTRQLIQSISKTKIERGALQKAGRDLDLKTGGKWVGDALVKECAKLPDGCTVLVDSVRIRGQVESIRDAFGERVTHVHLTSKEKELARRYSLRASQVKELKTYKQVRSDPTEAQVESLAEIADILIDTQQSSQEDVCVRVSSYLGLYGRSYDRLVDVIVGGEYGSEGKGHICSYLAPEYQWLIRVGGPNAGHKVYQRPHPVTFHQLPSGTLSSDAKIILGPGAVLNINIVLEEIARFQVPVDRLFIDPQAVIIEKSDIEFEKKTLFKTIGSTGQGVGSATARKILRGAKHPVRLAGEVKEFKRYIKPTCSVLDYAFSLREKVLLEGTQGSGLSLHHGEYPHVTSRETTVSGCLAEAGIAPSRVRKIVVVFRSYPIRVKPETGNSGPMRELTWKEIARRSGVPHREIVQTEVGSTSGRQRRVGEFDWTLLRKSASLNGPTDIALTFADYIDVENRNARRFDQLTPETTRFIEEIERVAAAPVSLITTRFHSPSVSIIDRRSW